VSVVPPQLTIKLSQILDAYITWEELSELASVFDVEIRAERRWLSVSKALTDNLNQGNSRLLVDNLVELCETRNLERIANTGWETREFHSSMTAVVQEAKSLLETSAAPSEVTLPAGNPFSAKSRVRELLETSQGGIFVVDPYVGVGTLDCLRGLTVPIRLLTANHGQAIEADFGRNLAAFVAEGHQVTVRTSGGLHDRHVMFNDRCWIVGGSLKDAGKKPFNCIEIADKAVVVNELETKWAAGTAFP
jgi:hypothetical protein